MIEDALRFEPPVAAVPRIALVDVVIRDKTVRAREIVQLSIAAANRDPSHFPDHDRFDAARNPHGVLSRSAGSETLATVDWRRYQSASGRLMGGKRAGASLSPHTAQAVFGIRRLLVSMGGYVSAIRTSLVCDSHDACVWEHVR